MKYCKLPLNKRFNTIQHNINKQLYEILQAISKQEIQYNTSKQTSNCMKYCKLSLNKIFNIIQANKQTKTEDETGNE